MVTTGGARQGGGPSRPVAKRARELQSGYVFGDVSSLAGRC